MWIGGALLCRGVGAPLPLCPVGWWRVRSTSNGGKRLENHNWAAGEEGWGGRERLE